MPRYIVVTPLRCGDGEEPIAPGNPVPAGLLKDNDARVLARLGALIVEDGDATTLPAPPPPPPPPPPPASMVDGAPKPKPLSAMKRAELAVEAEQAGVVIADGMTNKQLIAAIEAKRQEGAA